MMYRPRSWPIVVGFLAGAFTGVVVASLPYFTEHEELERCIELKAACRAAQLDLWEKHAACKTTRQDTFYLLNVLRTELQEHHQYVVPRLPVRKHYEWLLWSKKGQR